MKGLDEDFLSLLSKKEKQRDPGKPILVPAAKHLVCIRRKTPRLVKMTRNPAEGIVKRTLLESSLLRADGFPEPGNRVGGGVFAE